MVVQSTMYKVQSTSQAKEKGRKFPLSLMIRYSLFDVRNSIFFKPSMFSETIASFQNLVFRNSNFRFRNLFSLRKRITSHPIEGIEMLGFDEVKA
jgi:hypothetical protein